MLPAAWWQWQNIAFKWQAKLCWRNIQATFCMHGAIFNCPHFLQRSSHLDGCWLQGICRSELCRPSLLCALPLAMMMFYPPFVGIRFHDAICRPLSYTSRRLWAREPYDLDHDRRPLPYFLVRIKTASATVCMLLLFQTCPRTNTLQSVCLRRERKRGSGLLRVKMQYAQT